MLHKLLGEYYWPSLETYLEKYQLGGINGFDAKSSILDFTNFVLNEKKGGEYYFGGILDNPTPASEIVQVLRKELPINDYQELFKWLKIKASIQVSIVPPLAWPATVREKIRLKSEERMKAFLDCIKTERNIDLIFDFLIKTPKENRHELYEIYKDLFEEADLK